MKKTLASLLLIAATASTASAALVEWNATNNVVVGEIPLNTNASVTLSTTVPLATTGTPAAYTGANVYGAFHKESGTASWSVNAWGAAGLRLRVNIGGKGTGLYLFDTAGATLGAGATFDIGSSIYSSSKGVQNGFLKVVIEDSGSWYASADSLDISAAGGDSPTWNLDLSAANWLSYDPTGDPSGLATFGGAATPALTDVDFIGFVQQIDNPVDSNGNFGVRDLTVVPEPATFGLMAIASVALLLLRRLRG